MPKTHFQDFTLHLIERVGPTGPLVAAAAFRNAGNDLPDSPDEQLDEDERLERDGESDLYRLKVNAP